jgi:hypothetical protein
VTNTAADVEAAVQRMTHAERSHALRTRGWRRLTTVNGMEAWHSPDAADDTTYVRGAAIRYALLSDHYPITPQCHHAQSDDDSATTTVGGHTMPTAQALAILSMMRYKE